LGLIVHIVTTRVDVGWSSSKGPENPDDLTVLYPCLVTCTLVLSQVAIGWDRDVRCVLISDTTIPRHRADLGALLPAMLIFDHASWYCNIRVK
jgi:hypothetical protein